MVATGPACAIHTTTTAALLLLPTIPCPLLLHIATCPALLIVLLLLGAVLWCTACGWQGQLLLLLAASRPNALCAAAMLLHPLRHGLLCALRPLLVKLVCRGGVDAC